MRVDLQDLTLFDTMRRMTLSEHGIHVWRFPLIGTRQEMATVGQWLSEREYARLDGILSRVKRDGRMVAWGRLRFILSRYLDCVPGDVGIERTSSGRPEIVFPEGADLRFSLTHSGDHALLAVSRMAVGIDLEQMRPSVDVQALAARFFAGNESEAIACLPEDEQVEAFFRVWVRKEAYLKACGGSVPVGLSKCEVSVAAGEPRILATDFEEMDSLSQLVDLSVHKGYLAALAVQGGHADVRICDL